MTYVHVFRFSQPDRSENIDVIATPQLNDADKMIGELAQTIMDMWDVESTEVDEIYPHARAAASKTVARKGLIAVQHFIEVFDSLS